MEETIRLDLSPRGQLLGAIVAEVSAESAAAAKAFVDNLTDKQIQQLLALDGFTQEIKVPIWDDEKRDREPDKYLDSTTAPRDLADDLAGLIEGASDLEEIMGRINTALRLDKTHNQYWKRLYEILIPLPSIGGKRVHKLVVTTDLLSHEIWNQQTEGNITHTFPFTVGKSKKEVTTYVKINFDKLPDSIKKKLTYFDEEVYEAVANLWLVGNEFVSPSMIYGVHKDGNPGTEDIEKIDASITKMSMTHIDLSNEEEANNTNYPLFEYDASMLPMERSRCYINGQLVESAIHLFREPPFFSYAKSRGQITTVDRKLMQPPLNRSDDNLHLSKYILRVINAAKTGAIANKITYGKIFEELGTTDASKKTRIKKYTQRLFEFHKEKGNITSYTIDKTGITFSWKTNGKVQKN